MNSQLEEFAERYVLDELDGTQRASFEARLLHDPQLQGLVRDLENVLAVRIRALPQHQPPTRALDRIEVRLDEIVLGARMDIDDVNDAGRGKRTSWRKLVGWGIAALFVGGIGIISLRLAIPGFAKDRSPRIVVAVLESGRSVLSQVPLHTMSPSADGRFVQLASLAENYWKHPREIPNNLSTVDNRGRGFALFDPGSNQGFIAVRQLPRLDRNQRYHLWFAESGSRQPREVGALPLDGDDKGLYFFSFEAGAAPPTSRFNFFVTVEDTAATDLHIPEGRVVLGNKRI